jgi:5,5'-dehydrodivanillate O-demethylase
MLTQEVNERLSRVGPGTSMGNLLRRYWHPVATCAEVPAGVVIQVKALGETLALYRNDDGDLGLVSERCPHRGASLACGIPERDGLRCPYHGWKFDAQGHCLEQPAEPADSRFHHRIRIPAYPVQELGGLVWAYMGPEPAPLITRYDLFVREDLDRSIGVTKLPCNWLQIMENSFDPVHREYLHGLYSNYVLRQKGSSEAPPLPHHEKIAFDVFEFGVTKRRLVEGQNEDDDDWRVGHPVLWPTILSVGNESSPSFQIRVPIDDTNTLHFWYLCKPAQKDSPHPPSTTVFDLPYKDEQGHFIVDTVSGQDMMVWITQGALSDRTTERLGTSDKGVILYRRLLLEHLEMLERGEDPPGVVRDPAHNQMIEVPRERTAHYVAGDFLAVNKERVSFARRG